jgi:PPOX class probable F420-dependent enzyme
MSTPEWVAFVNAGTRTGKLATVRADGSAHVAPVWFLVEDEGTEIRFNTGADTVKGRALARDPRFSLCVDDERPPFSFVQINAEASLTDCGENPGATLPHAIAFASRYVGDERGEQYGKRNNAAGEYLVRGRITKVVALAEIADSRGSSCRDPERVGLLGERVVGAAVEEHEPDQPRRARLIQAVTHGAQRDPRRRVHRPAVHAGGDRRERHAFRAELGRNRERGAVAVGEQFGAVLGGGMHRPDGVDHPRSGQLARSGRHRLPGRQTVGILRRAQLAARGEDLRPAAPVDRAVYAATTEQRGVRRVHHRVGLLRGDVTGE